MNLARRSLAVVVLLFCTLSIHAGQLAPDDTVQLTATREPGGQIHLHWTGGSGAYGVFRSANASSVLDPMNLAQQTAANDWIDTTLADFPIDFYIVTNPPCVVGADCLSGFCVDGMCCSTSCVGACRACNLSGSFGTCTNIPFGQDPINECVGITTCNGAGACALLANGQSCAVSPECASGNCVDGVCCNSTCIGLCRACNVAGSLGTCANVPNGQDPANECSGVTTCNGGGGCALRLNGQTCGTGAECQSANCVDGVCCNLACSGLCTACNVTGSLGTCSNVPNGQDPANECIGGTTCNGSGGCTP